MKKEEKVTNFWKYALLVVGGILILVPLLVTVVVPLRLPRTS